MKINMGTEIDYIRAAASQRDPVRFISLPGNQIHVRPIYTPNPI